MYASLGNISKGTKDYSPLKYNNVIGKSYIYPVFIVPAGCLPHCSKYFVSKL